ncbi:unnamed protein product [Kuraishia capsulata CBS 1993]|uniref:Cytochrome c oxidase assembly protein COX15 n=1 Tax=Kuraishia capsulata CBS 1993 TaxID=1382522 RepID=W6MQ32_9ASCO|nr:uncharacterized protein KUCA_T00003330001 [Kuraishia capsulata CBS 1993]CDK27352.1 unnamed protein product [Kuraishia capsulata CBS 1993]
MAPFAADHYYKFYGLHQPLNLQPSSPAEVCVVYKPMSLCKSQFFFIKNSSVLQTFPKSRVSRFSLNANGPQGQSLLRKLWFPTRQATQLQKRTLARSVLLQRLGASPFKRSYSTITADSIAESVNVSKPRFTLNTDKRVAYMCMGSAVLVAGIVILGGLTRLTESGLSITEWKPVTGALPPLTQDDWEREFEKYKASPEFKQLNSHITLEDYKFIYGMEWSHRLLGRIIGTVFVLPSIYFVARRRCSVDVAWKLAGISALIGVQGFIGWWMVASGLDEVQLAERNSKPTVSPYRLTAHLGVAFVVCCSMVYTGLQILKQHALIRDPEKYLGYFKQINSPNLKLFKRLSNGLFGMVFVTALTGALVAGLDAGLIYNTFPHMGENWVPSSRELMDPVYSRTKDSADLWWRNLLENPTTVQLNHRIMAVSTFCYTLALHLYSHRIKSNIPKPAYKALTAAIGVASLQVTLGICTLLWLVPTELAAAHQAGALTLLTTVLVLVQKLRKPTVSDMMLLRRVLGKTAEQAAKSKVVFK